MPFSAASDGTGRHRPGSNGSGPNGAGPNGPGSYGPGSYEADPYGPGHNGAPCNGASCHGAEPLPAALKLLVAGGFGVGKTTFVGAVSEIEPLTTEEVITTASAGVDSLHGVEHKATTTVALDFGRITLTPGLVLYLFGAPGQDRFWFMWDELAGGALGAVVLADTRRLEACFPAVDFFENRGIEFVVAVNEFDGAFRYEPGEIRAAVGLSPRVPVARCDARDPHSATAVLVELVRHLVAISPAPPTGG